MTTLTLFSPWDMNVAYENFDAMCGHGALAAALGTHVCLVMRYFGRGGWVNIPGMKAAIASAGRTCFKTTGIPSTGAGVIMVQFLGSWMNDGVPIAARCAHRHWIGLREGQIWDSNNQLWLTPREWDEWVSGLYPKKATGHEFIGTYMLNEITTP